MTDPNDRNVFALREAFHKTTAALLTHGHARDILRELEAAGFSLSLLADRARMEKAIKIARGILLYPTNEMLTESADMNTTGTLAAADALLAVEPGIIKPGASQ